MQTKQVIQGTILLHLAAFFWGGSFIPQKILIMQGIPIFYMTALRFSCVIFILFLLDKSRLSKQSLKYGLVLGGLLSIAFYSQNYGLQYIDASISAFLTSVSLIMIPVFNFLFFRKRITKYNFYAIISAVIGIIIFNQLGVSDSSSELDLSIIVTLIGSVAFTLHIVLSDYFLEKGDSPINLHILQCVVLSVVAFVGGFLTEEFPTEWTPLTISALIYLGVFASIVSYGAQAYGQHLTRNPLKAGLIFSLEPAWAFMLAIPLLGETLSAGKMLGILFISIGIVFCEWETLMRLKNLKRDKQHENKV